MQAGGKVPRMASRAHIALRRKQADAALELSRVQRELERRVQLLLALEKLDDVTPAQANALMILFQEKAPMTARTLARQMNLSEVTVGRFVRALETTGWVTREADPKDTRAILIQPSKKAYRAFSRFLTVSNGLLEHAFSGFTKQELDTLISLVERVRMNVVVEV
jgi:DNA-binding MarR family transcriptional regulator